MLRIDFLGSGSEGNATLIRWGQTCLLLDCGFGPRRLKARLDAIRVAPAAIDAVLITHEHRDHWTGLPLLSPREELRVFSTRRTARRVDFGRRAACQREEIHAGSAFFVGEITVHPFSTSHDARDPVGYAFALPDGQRLGMAYDLGYASDEVVDALRGCDYLGLEANHDPHMLSEGPYPAHLKRRIRSGQGHLSNEQAAGLLRRAACARLQHVFGMHVSKTNNRPALVQSVLSAELRQLGLTPEVTVVEQDRVLSFPGTGQLSLF